MCGVVLVYYSTDACDWVTGEMKFDDEKAASRHTDIQ